VQRTAGTGMMLFVLDLYASRDVRVAVSASLGRAAERRSLILSAGVMPSSALRASESCVETLSGPTLRLARTARAAALRCISQIGGAQAVRSHRGGGRRRPAAARRDSRSGELYSVAHTARVSMELFALIREDGVRVKIYEHLSEEGRCTLSNDVDVHIRRAYREVVRGGTSRTAQGVRF